jgi:hypothetical protein
MIISQLIKKLQDEQRKWGDIEVVAHAPNKPGLVVDVATFEGMDGGYGRSVRCNT